jgi:hypothetical protein
VIRDCDCEIAGTMVGTNPGADPLFYLLHGYADLIFERWIRAQMKTGLFDRTSNIPQNEHFAIGQGYLECQGIASYLALWPCWFGYTLTLVNAYVSLNRSINHVNRSLLPS